MAETEDPFGGDAGKGWQYSDAKAALVAAILDGEIPLEPDVEEEDDDLLWEYFNLRPEIHNYGGFEKYFRRRLADTRAQIVARIVLQKIKSHSMSSSKTIQNPWQLRRATILNGKAPRHRVG